MTTPGWAERLLLQFSPRLWQVLLMMLAGLAVLVVIGDRFSAQLEDVRGSQSDNTAWLVSQLEVEALKLERAVTEARLAAVDPPLAPIRNAFDLYLSRVKVITGNLGQSDVLGPIAQTGEWAELERATGRLRTLVDVPDDRLAATLPEIARELQALRRPMREAVVNSLRLIIRQGTEGREALAILFARSALVAIGIILLLFLAVWSTLTLAKSLRRRTYEAERVRSNLERTIDASLDGVILVRKDGRVQDANPAAEVIFGYCRSELLAAPDLVDLLLPPEIEDAQTDRLRQMLRTVPEAGLPDGRIEVLARRKDGQAIPVELALTRDRDADGEMLFFAFLRDISERRRYETSLHAARDSALQAAEAKARFLAVMSHEMRTPLNGVIAALDILRETTRLTARQARFLGIAESSGQSALEQINDVLELARLDAGTTPEEMSAFHLAEALRGLSEQAEPLAARQDNRIVLELAPGTERWILGPRRSLQRVLLNLVGNAAKFTSGGTITLSARLAENDAGALRAELAVADTGIGIAADKLEAIFDPFEQIDNGYDRMTEGTGLGLGIARRTVEMLGGTVRAESVAGRGSSFHVSLPVAPAARPAGPAATACPPYAKAALPVGDILIVEDNLTNRLVLREMLRHLGQRVTEASNGAEAIRLAEGRAFGLIFMDISMPEIDGIAATTAIRAGGASSGARIVGLTAHDLPEDLGRFRVAGMTEVLQKPVTFATLIPWIAPEKAVAPQAGPAAEAFDHRIAAELSVLLALPQRRSLVADFLNEGDDFLRALATGQESGALVPLAHRLKGAASVLGATGFARNLAVLENDLLAHRTPDAAGQEAVIAAWRRVGEELPALLLRGEPATKQ